jgi:hypothetical protein
MSEQGSGATRSPYIAGPGYDWAFFLLPPLLAVAVGWLIGGTPFAERSIWIGDRRSTGATLFIGALVHAHLVAVFARSHLNPEIFRLHRVRFVLVPLVLFAAMMASARVAVAATVLVVFWDAYHSALQTFGLGRIYDRLAGNAPEAGRRLDLGLNLLLYLGPIVAGATMLAHVEKLDLFTDVDVLFFSRGPVFMASHQPTLAWLVGGGSVAYVLVYLLAYVRLARSGHRVSLPKVFLLSTTGLCSVWVWCTNPWGQAFFIMNLFHAVQYLALVWWAEGARIQRLLSLPPGRLGPPLAALGFLVVVGVYGLLAEVSTEEQRVSWCITQVVALMHFFYDGFIWSVRRRQIA